MAVLLVVEVNVLGRASFLSRTARPEQLFLNATTRATYWFGRVTAR